MLLHGCGDEPNPGRARRYGEPVSFRALQHAQRGAHSARKAFTRRVMGQGEQTCQACLDCAVEQTPIPAGITRSVTFGLFGMPAVKHEGPTYDTMAVCVDRQPVWIVAEPSFGKGLNWAKSSPAYDATPVVTVRRALA